MAAKKYFLKVGDVYDTNFNGKLCIASDIPCKGQYLIRFLATGFEKYCDPKEILNGYVKDPLMRSVLDVGYKGIGAYHSNCKISGKPPYRFWTQMLKRCYDKDYYLARRYSEKDVYVCDEWHNFQNFFEWCIGQPNFVKPAMSLDKDLEIWGNKMYSPEACEFIPVTLNSMLTSRVKERGAYPVGVSKSAKSYRAECNNHKGTKVLIGLFKTPCAAFSAYKEFKEETVKWAAEHYYSKGEISYELYCNLKTFEAVPYPK